MLPSASTLLSSITIPNDMYYNNTKQDFLFCNSSKVIAFALEQCLEILSENSHWNADGRFRTAPALFTQAYYIHVWDEFSMKAVVFACCEDKSQEGYHRLFTSLITYANISLNPSSILIDFEQATINAISNVFSQASVKGCHFHDAKNVWKKIKNYGLVKLLKQENIRRNIISLPLISPNEINNSMEKIIDDVNSKFDKLTDYIINNYIDDGRFSLIISIRLVKDLVLIIT